MIQNEAFLIEIAEKFYFKGTLKSVKPYGDGLINRTYLVTCEDENKKEIHYIMQAINHKVFAHPGQLMENIVRVTKYLQRQEDDPRRVMHVCRAGEKKYYYRDNDGNYWRMYRFVEDSICLNLPEQPGDFYECGFAFGRFQKQLNNFPLKLLFQTIPHFHNTPLRYKALLKAEEEDICGRVKTAEKELSFFEKYKDFYSTLFKENSEGRLPYRISHNDTKMNNVLLDAKTRKALCVIDLDTIMLGFSVTDFGDAIRFGANTAAEDERDLSKVDFDLEQYREFTSGYLTGSDGAFNDTEIMLMPEGAKMMTLECGMRFLTDYLSGDIYFKTTRDGHNLDRCRTQIRLVEKMEENWDSMKQTVSQYLKVGKNN